jgi:predicted regulator of Ras-like GTPase activity (Roadblock/LC7/MglB family)
MRHGRVRVPSLHRVSAWFLSASGLTLFVLAPLIAPGDSLRGPSSLPAWVPWIAPPLLFGLLLVGLPGLTAARRVFGAIALCAFHAGLMLTVPPIVALLDVADPWPWVESLWGFPAAPIIQLLAVPLVVFPLRDLLVPPSRRRGVEAERMPTPSPLRTGRGWDDAGTHTIGGERLREDSGEPQPTPELRRGVRDVTPPPLPGAPRPATSVPRSDTGRVPTGRISATTPPRAFTGVAATTPPPLAGPSPLDVDVLAPPPPPAPDPRAVDTAPPPAVPPATGSAPAASAAVQPAITEPLEVQPIRIAQVPTEPIVVEPARVELPPVEPVRATPAVIAEPVRVEPARVEPAVVVEPVRVEPSPPAAPAVASRPVVEPVREATAEPARPLAAPVIEPSPTAPPPLPALEPAEIARTLAPAGVLHIEYRTLMGIGVYTACGSRLNESVVTSMAFRALAFLTEAPTAQSMTQVTLRGAAGALVVTPLGRLPGAGPVLAVALPQRGALALIEILALRVAGEYRAAHATGAAPPPATAGAPAGAFREAPVPARVGALVRSLASGESLRPVSLESGSLTLHLLLEPGADAERFGRLASDLYRLVELEAEPGGIGPVQSVVVRLGSQRVVVQPVAPGGGRSTLLVAATAADRPGLTRLQLERVAARLGEAPSGRI